MIPLKSNPCRNRPWHSTLLAIISFFVAIDSKAQSDSLTGRKNHQLIASFTGGIAIPMGRFSKFEIDSSSYTENISGIARMGHHGKLQISYLFTGHVGIACLFLSSFHKAKEVDYAALFYDPHPWTHGLGGGTNLVSYSYSTEDWRTHAITLNIMIAASNEQPQVFFRLGGGIQMVKSAESTLSEVGYSWQINYPSYPYDRTTVQPSMTSHTLVANGGMDVLFAITQRMGVQASVDYLFSRPYFNGESNVSGSYYNNFNGEQHSYKGIKEVSFTKNVSLLNINLGLYFGLW